VRKKDRILSGGLAAGFLLLYLATLCRGVYLGDSGELIAAGALLDIAHPPGYPLYCLAARVFAALGSGSAAVRVHALSAFAAALSVGLFYGIARRHASVFASLIGALLLGISSLLWSHAAVAEVYTPHLLFLLAGLFFLGRSPSRGDRGLAAWFGGLSLASHPLGLGFLPLLALEIATGPRERRSARAIAETLTLFALPLTLFLYLPIRSALDPPTDWGNPETLRSFAAHVFRLQYRDVPKPDASPTLYARELSAWTRSLFSGSLPATLLPLVLLGTAAAVVRRARSDLALLAGLLGFGPLLVVYLRFPLAPERVEENMVFFLPALSFLLFFLATGVDALLGALGPEKILRFACGGVIALVVLLGAGQALGSHRFDEVVLPERYARDVLGSVPPNGALVAAGDDILFPLLYLKRVERMRDDVPVRDAEGIVFPGIHSGASGVRVYTFPAPGLVPRGLLFAESGTGLGPAPGAVPLSSGEAALARRSVPLRALWTNYWETRARSEPAIEEATSFRRAALEVSGEPLPRDEERARRYAEATVLVDRGGEAEAAEILEGILGEAPHEALPRLLLAEIALRRGEREEAMRLASLETFPSASTLARGAAVFLYAGDRLRGREMLEEAARRDPTSADPLVALQRLADSEGRTEEGARIGRRALEIDPTLSEVRLRLARAYRAAGNSERAAREYRILLRTDPGCEGAEEAQRFVGPR
jgi:thioredoxin-like negative regulator of GroEL